MSLSRVPAILLSAWLMLSPPPVRAEDRLPDEAAVKAFTETEDFTLNGWWRVQDLPFRPTPGELLFFDWQPGPPTVLRAKLVSGSIRAGKGSLTECEFALEFSEDGELTSATTSAVADDLTERLTLKAADGDKWTLDSFSDGKAMTLTAQDFAEAVALVEKHSAMDGGFMRHITTIAQNFTKPSAPPAKITAVQVPDGKKNMLDAWRVEIPGLPCILNKADGRVLQFEMSGHTLVPAGVHEEALLRTAMKEKNDPPVNPLLIDTLSLTFHGADRKWFSPARTRSVKSRGSDAVEVVTGVENPEPEDDRTSDLTIYTKPDAALTGHAKFKKIVEEMEASKLEPGGDETSPAETATRFGVAVRRSIERDFDSRTAGPGACLDAGKGDLIAMTQLVVQGCRLQGAVCREVHGFVVEPDSLPVIVQRRSWVEVLEDGQWEGIDPWMSGKPDEDGALSAPRVTGFHVEVCHGTPSETQEKFLNSDPAVTVNMKDLERFQDPSWSPAGGSRMFLEKPRSK